MKPQLTVTMHGKNHVFPMYWEDDAVSIGGEWLPGLAMRDDAFAALEQLAGIFAEVPMYCYNEGNMLRGPFEDEDEVTVGTWSIEL